MAGQNGGGSLQGVALPAANGATQQKFFNMVVGCVAALYLTVLFSLISTAGAFALVISTSSAAVAEGVDDADILTAAIFRQLLFQIDAKCQVGLFGMARWRSILGYLNQRDFLGTLMGGGNVPASNTSAKAFTLKMKFPLSLSQLFTDGGIFRQGSDRLKQGGFFGYYMGALGNAVLANGTATISAISVNVDVELGYGLPSDIGPAWTAAESDGVATRWPLGPQRRIGAFATVPVATNSVVTYNIEPLYQAVDPTFLGGKYQSERLAAGGYDITARMTPIYWIEMQRTFADFGAGLGEDLEVQALSGVSSQNLLDMQIEENGSTTVADISTQVGGGGDVATAPIAPKSMQASGGTVPEHLRGLSPTRIVPGAAAPAGAQRLSPVQAGQAAHEARVAGRRNTGAKRLLRGR